MAEEKKRWLSALQTKFENSMSAVTFAEANDQKSARDFLDLETTRQEAVLLVVQDSQVSKRVAHYAAALCRRMGCGLTVLNVLFPLAQQEEDPAVLETRLRETVDVSVRLFSSRGTLPDVVRKFVRQQRRILSVVMDDSYKKVPRPAKNRAIPQPRWQDIGCPIIFVPAT